MQKTAAASPRKGMAAELNKTGTSNLSQPPTEPQEMTGRQLLLDLAQSVNDLCIMVQGWRSEIDRLRDRVTELERRAA